MRRRVLCFQSSAPDSRVRLVYNAVSESVNGWEQGEIMPAQEIQLRKLIESMIIAHQGDQMDCEMCNQNLGCLAEQVAMGAKLHDLLPAMELHLACCQDCAEEFQALVCILRAELNGQLQPPND